MAWYENIFSRSFGGTYEDYVVDPFISGYGYPYFTLPSAIFGNDTTAEIKLSATCRTLTLNNISLETTVDEVVGGIKAHYPSRLTMIEEIQASFLADMDGEVVDIFRKWINYIRDIRYGTANLMNNQYSKKNYSGIIYYFVVKPDGFSIIDGFAFTGCFPKAFPMDVYNLDLATNEKKMIEISFSIDNVYTLKELVTGEGQSNGIRTKFQNSILQKIENVKKKIQTNFRSTSNLK